MFKSKQKLHHLVLIGILLIFGVAIFSSCTEDGIEPVPCDGDCINEKLAVAYNSLEAKLYEYNAAGAEDPDYPDDIDFRGPLADYQDAYNTANENLEARFGLSICRLLVLSMDAEVNAAFDEWEAYLDENTPFEVDVTGGGKALGISVGMPSANSTLKLPYELVYHMVGANLNLARAGAEPQITRTQDILKDRVLPEVLAALTLLAPVAADPSFTYVLSGRMQGNATSAAEEIDQTDVLALKAGYQLLAAACNIAVAYDLQLVSYDEAGILAGFDQDNGNIMTLRTGGAAHLGAVPSLFIAAIDDIDAAITSLLNESDDQENDIIKLGPDGLDEDDVIDIRDNYLADARAVFQGPVERVDDWDFDSSTPDEALTIDLHQFFTNPVNNWKQQVPPYTMTTEARDYSGHVNTEVEGVLAEVAVDLNDMYRYPQCSVGFYDYDIGWTSNWGSPPEMVAALEDLAAEKLVFLQSQPDWAGRAHLRLSSPEVLNPGAYTVDLDWVFEYTTAETFVSVPVLTWTADTFEDWKSQWPDPTLGGLLPEMDSADELSEFFSFTDENWEKSTIFDWANGNFGAVPSPHPPGF